MPSQRPLTLAGVLFLGACSLAYPLGDFSDGKATDAGLDASNSDDGSGGGGGVEGGGGGGADDNQPLLFYGTGEGALRARRFNGTTWTSAITANVKVDAGRVIHWIVARRVAPRLSVLGVYSALPDRSQSKLQVFETTDSGATLTPAFETTDFVATATGGLPARRTFDLAVEGSSRRVVAVYGGAGNLIPKVRVRDPKTGTWSTERDAFTTGGANNVAFHWFELVTRTGSDELVLLSVDRVNALRAARWAPDLGTFGPPSLLANPLEEDNFRTFAGVFESKSGELMIAWAANDRAFFVTAPTNQPIPTINDRRELDFAKVGALCLAADPNSDQIALTTLGFVCNGATCDDYATWTWNGSAFEGVEPTVIDGDITEAYGSRDGSLPLSIAWTNDGQAVAPYFRSGANGGFRWTRYSSQARVWTRDEPPVLSTPAMAAKSSFIPFHDAEGRPGFVVSDVNGDLWAKRFDGTAWFDTEGGAALANNLPTVHGVPFAVDLP